MVIKMSETPPPDVAPLNGRDRTPELTTKREKRHRDDEEDDHRSGRSHRHHREREDDDYERERERRHRRREEPDDERRERHRRRHHDDETEEEREERRQRRKEREVKEREREKGREGRNSRELERSPRRSHRGGSRESHRSHRSRDVDKPAVKEMTREEKEAEREKRDREMIEERREAVRQREIRREEMDREREQERYARDGPMRSPPRRRRPSPVYDRPPPPAYERPPPPPSSPPPPADPVTQLLNEVDSESRSIFVSQLAARLTSSDLGSFFEDKLGRGAVRDARVVTDRVSRRSKGIAYVELDAVELVHRAMALNGTTVMGIPIQIQLTEAELNREGQLEAAMNGTWQPPPQRERERDRDRDTYHRRERAPDRYQSTFPPLSTGLHIPYGVDVDAHKEASIPYHRLFISSLAYNLSAEDLRQVFEAFGTIEFVDMHLEYSGQNKGTAYVQFKDLRSAQMALDAMNGFELAGRPIRVQTIQDRSNNDAIEDPGYAPKMDNNSRQQLMFKLARTEPGGGPAPPPRVVAPTKAANMQPTLYVAVNNMFNPEEETERNWDLDLAEDVKSEVEGKYGKLKRVKVEKMSAGEVYLHFESVTAAGEAIAGLNGRFFGGRQLQASFISEALFKAHM